MNWDTASAIAEVVGATAVVITLLYLAIQVKASAKASSVEAKLATARMHTDFMSQLIQNPDLNDIFFRGIRDQSLLSKEEYQRFSNMALQAFTYFSAGYYQFEQGTVDQNEWHESREILRFWLNGQGGRDWWNRVGSSRYSPKFVAYVEKQLHQTVAH